MGLLIPFGRGVALLFHRIFTQDGVFHLHSVDQHSETLSMLQCWDYLETHGFTGLWPLQATSLGDLVFSQNDHSSYMVASKGGRSGELGLRIDAVKAASILAKLHLLSQDLPLSLQGGLPKSKPTIRELTQKREELDLFRNMALHRLYPTAFDLFFARLYEDAVWQADRAIHILGRIDVEQLQEEPQLVGLLQGTCHGRSFWVTDDGNLRLVHLLGSSWGLLVQDVAALLANIGCYAEWSLTTAWRALAAYQGIRPLRHIELELIYGLGIFPKRIWEVAHDHYKGSRNRDESEAVEALRQERQRASNQREYWHYLLGDELGYEDRSGCPGSRLV